MPRYMYVMASLTAAAAAAIYASSRADRSLIGRLSAGKKALAINTRNPERRIVNEREDLNVDRVLFMLQYSRFGPLI